MEQPWLDLEVQQAAGVLRLQTRRDGRPRSSAWGVGKEIEPVQRSFRSAL
jgi:hypothetical protein